MQILKPKYEAKLVFKTYATKQWIVVNKLTGDCHSCWESKIDADKVARDLNLN